uniref:Shugoshin 1 n=1 Tax=Chelonoidis abingdonii TaxID=106734 RepID=A0A8C0H5H9_CHEAB
MGREKCLKRSFKDSLDDIKERMKEKRNQKWAKLGKTNQVFPIKCKIATNSSVQLKSLQANNRALALALQEEKAKMKEAQDIILHLKKEYQSLKFQIFVLQRKLSSQQVREPVEVFSLSDFHLDNLEANLENILLDEEDRQVGNILPKTVSTRRRCSNRKIHVHNLDHSERAYLTREFCKQDETRLEGNLEKGNIENIEPNLSQLNENKINMKPMLDQADTLTELNCSVAEPELKQIQPKSREDSQTRREKGQKGKLEGSKKTSRTRSKRERSQEEQTSKVKLDLSVGSNKAYDFQFEENVHITPFRQNKMNDCDRDVDERKDTSESETHSSEGSDSEENSDDSLYVPYRSKSKYRKSSQCKSDGSLVHTRPRSKRSVVYQQQKTTGKPEASQTSRLHLCDVTNISSLSGTKSRISHPFLSIDEKPGIPSHKRRCTINVNYKEPSISRKLRRGDPFTDMCFLNSPIFKQKKDPKHSSVKKESLSKYNEAFVGCR